MPPRLEEQKRRAEARFLAAYRPEDYSRPSVAVDLVVLTILDSELRVLLVRRKEPPFAGQLALPGGFVRVGDGKKDRGEDLDQAARRELAEETGLRGHPIYLEQLGAFGRPDRDPRMRVISVAYFALVRPDLAPLVRPGGDAGGAGWFLVKKAQRLAFDHDEILAAALARVRREIDGTHLAFELVPETFTQPELRAVFEVVKGQRYDPGNFRRRFLALLADGVVERAPGRRVTSRKPAQVYRFHRPERAP